MTDVQAPADTSDTKPAIVKEEEPVLTEEQLAARERFSVELEFVQCLSNPWYINFLAQQGYFDDPRFVKYLDYLKYWKRPEYAKFIIYPNALKFLDLLQIKAFRDEMKKVERATWVHQLQYFHWRWPNQQQEEDV